MTATSMPPTSTRLTDAQRQQFERDGCLSPIRVLDDDEVARNLAHYDDHVARNRERIAALTATTRYRVFSQMHFVTRWAYELARHPRVLDAVESLIGPDILAWDTNWFSKPPGDRAYVSWHQDGTYWKLDPPDVVTAWVALTPSVETNGGLRVVPGTHTRPMLPQRETYAPDNALSRGQEIAVEVDEAHARTLALQPGQMSLHHIWIVHGSKANTSDVPRIGIAIRYVSPAVHQDSPGKPLAVVVRGRDTHGNFELLPPPTADVPAEGEQQRIVDRIRASIMQPAPKA